MAELTLAQRIACILYDKKALDIKVLHVGHLTVITDYMVIASGRNAIQVRALAEEVEEKLEVQGVKLHRKEGHSNGHWVVMDYGTVLVHLFHPDEREFYRLERLWEDGQNQIALPFISEEHIVSFV